ncbi:MULTISPECIES: RNA polymerase sigma factor [Microbacterium]|uniref:Sigma-70 family RNA polymerase sigma factor n=1 Tax=Microbacterium marmarense TaxID=3122051 RepID=A0ABU8LWE3_9MICO
MNGELDDESALWALSRKGDEGSFARLFDLHRNRVYRHTVWHLGTREDAEDATAGAFLELWRLRNRVVLVDGSVLPWLLVTATNVARNLGRSRRRYRAVLDRLPREAPTVDEVEALSVARLDAQRRLSTVVPSLRALSSSDHALLMLTAVEGMPVATAATAVGLTPGAARTRLHRIKSRLRDQLGSIPLEVPDELRS